MLHSNSNVSIAELESISTSMWRKTKPQTFNFHPKAASSSGSQLSEGESVQICIFKSAVRKPGLKSADKL